VIGIELPTKWITEKEALRDKARARAHRLYFGVVEAERAGKITKAEGFKRRGEVVSLLEAIEADMSEHGGKEDVVR
jgi:hypothetical protein